MPNFTARQIKNQDVRFPYRYNLKEPGTSTIVDTLDLVPTWKDNPSEVIQYPTDIIDTYLQPIEYFLEDVGAEMAGLDTAIKSVDTKLTSSEAALNTKITASESSMSAKITANETAMNSRISSSESALNSTITTKESALNTKITAADGRITATNTTIGTLAPKVNAVLTNPTATTQAQTNNSTYIATTAWARTYLTNLFAAHMAG